MRNLEQTVGAQCAGLEQRQHASKIAHSQRMKMMSFSHVGLAKDAHNRNATDLKTRRHESTAKRQTQQKKVDAVNERHHQSIDGEKARHGQEMYEMKSEAKAKTATHKTKMGRMKDKNVHKKDDANHMALHFVALDSKLQQSEARCAEHERTLADKAETVLKSERRRDLLVAQSEVIAAVKAVIAKEDAEAAEQRAAMKRSIFSRDDKEKKLKFMRNKIRSAIDSNRAFDDEMAAFMGMLSELNE